MFKISDGREYFYQWDLNRQLIVADSTIKEVHFCNRANECSLVAEVIDGLANVPNLILQHSFDVRVFAYDGNATRYEQVFKVKPRSKPSDYVYTENEIQTYKQLEARLDEIEEKGLSGEVVEEAVNNYMEEHPINMEGYATEDYVNNAISNLDIPEVDLSGYAKKEDIPDTSSFITETALEGYAKTTDIPDVSTKLDTTAAGSTAKIPYIGVTGGQDWFTAGTNYDTKIPVRDTYGRLKVWNPSTSYDAANKAYVDAAIPDVSAFQTEAQVIALIQANMPASGDEVSY